ATHEHCRGFGGVDLIVALGGGSVLDLAKCMKHRFLNHSPAHPNALPLLAIPTTAGTGSEATPFATYFENGSKRSLEDPALTPNAVILDPILPASLPQKNRIACALDALAQSVEALWSMRSTSFSRDRARQSIRKLVRHFPFPEA